MAMLRRRVRPVMAIIAVALTAATAAGCDRSPDAAATVGGTAITRDQLQQARAGATQVLGEGNEITSDQVLSAMIQGEVAAQIAADRHIAITDGERDAKLNAKALSVPEARDFVYDVADTNIVAAAIGTKEFQLALAKAKVEVNPRYGAWQPNRSLTVIPDNGSLSQVLAPPAP